MPSSWFTPNCSLSTPGTDVSINLSHYFYSLHPFLVYHPYLQFIYSYIPFLLFTIQHGNGYNHLLFLSSRNASILSTSDLLALIIMAQNMYPSNVDGDDPGPEVQSGDSLSNSTDKACCY